MLSYLRARMKTRYKFFGQNCIGTIFNTYIKLFFTQGIFIIPSLEYALKEVDSFIVFIAYAFLF